jgi:hypothetical protein
VIPFRSFRTLSAELRNAIAAPTQNVLSSTQQANKNAERLASVRFETARTSVLLVSFGVDKVMLIA